MESSPHGAEGPWGKREDSFAAAKIVPTVL